MSLTKTTQQFLLEGNESRTLKNGSRSLQTKVIGFEECGFRTLSAQSLFFVGSFQEQTEVKKTPVGERDITSKRNSITTSYSKIQTLSSKVGFFVRKSLTPLLQG